MREKTLAELFARDNETIEVDGREVRSVARLPVKAGDQVTVTRLTATRTRPQGIVLGVDDGVLELNGHEASVLALWSTTAPREVEFTVGSGISELELWNAWQEEGVEHSWVGNAGLVVQQAGDTTTLQCSDGLGEADFTDLVVQVVIGS